MKNTFNKKNNIGLDIKYSIIATYDNKYVLYTDYMPSSSSIFGIRLFVGKIIDKEKFKVVDVTPEEEKEVLDNFEMQVLQTSTKNDKKKGV